MANYHSPLRFSVVFILLFLFSSFVFAQPKDNAISNQTCINCHQSEHKKWSLSDHAKAMDLANEQTVLGDFNNKSLMHFGHEGRFYRQDNKFFMSLIQAGKQTKYEISYVFGHAPLQQYLTKLPDGKMHVLPFVWDSRDKSEGGQRWYNLYDETILPTDRLHWLQPLQNWNGMCADCHSDGLVRNYDAELNKFDSQWDNINVGCLSCHGDMTLHAEENEKTKKASHRNNITPELKQAAGMWLRQSGEKIAQWQGEPRDNQFMDTCFACHSLRSPLVDGLKAGSHFLDLFTPQLIQPPLYHADGQIKEEVYVYGSFLQSKMHAAGVNCLDCHDKHTMKVKSQDNGLCLQCHSPEEYNAKSHHQHEIDSSGAQCVNCHMPENRYMGVDDRRDHSFKIPRPDLATEFDTPNACTQCHTEKNAVWASKNLEKWHGKPTAVNPNKLNFMRLMQGQSISLGEHIKIVDDEKLDEITRASALAMLSYHQNALQASMLVPYVKAKDDLLRLAVSQAATVINVKARTALLKPLLSDKRRAIRTGAAYALADAQLYIADSDLFKRVFDELSTAQAVNSWRGEGRLNQGNIALQQGNVASAIETYLQAIKIDPYFDVSYINLADLYRGQNKVKAVADILTLGIKNNPLSAILNYSYGLHLIRQKQVHKSINLFKKAFELDSSNAQYLYTFTLALDNIGQTNKALQILLTHVERFKGNAQVQEMGLYLAQKLNERAAYQRFIW
ncbi:multiheme c-type cytochrome [Algibacillus agarilyticus]|uniref:multiheme c-type cytochrome n=1 Tax=Algibacillus agarilyticus TaxID=2234133 RepID=UPI000DD03468|nr:multiheme c-type cytochrome [Algibacillus agarilyticus]